MVKTAKGYRLIFGYLGIFFVVFGLICLFPLILLPFYQNESSNWFKFVIPGVISIAVGLILYFVLIFKRKREQLGKHQDSILLVLIWLFAIFTCAVPFMLGGMNFTDSVFETTSGYATVGLTRFFINGYEGINSLHIYQFYRSILLFFGGVGLVLVVTSALSDRYGLKIYTAEGHNDKLLPNLGKSARLILSIYVGIILIGSLAYFLSGMEYFDSLCHSISCVATGGFSTNKDGIIATVKDGGNIYAVEAITCILSTCGATNFLLHLFFITGKHKKFIRDCETRLFLCCLVIFIPLFTVSTFVGNLNHNLSWFDSFRYGSFTFISAISTTGFSNVPAGASLNLLGPATIGLTILVTLIGGGLGSTAGGPKQYRIYIALRTIYWSTRDRLASSRVVYPHFIWRFGEQKQIKKGESFEALGYILIYLIFLALGTFLISIIGGISVENSLFEFTNALSSAGLSIGVTSTANNGVLWVLIVGMFAGRLEITAIYFAIYRIIRDLCRKETN